MSETKEEVLQKVNADDAEVMQKFADAYTSGDNKFWDRDYPYGAYVLGEIVSNYAKEASSYTGFVDKVLAPRTAKCGEIIRYDKDVDALAYVLDEKCIPQTRQEGRMVYPPEFEIEFMLEFPEKVKNGKKFIHDLMGKALKKLVTVQDTALVKLLHYITAKKEIPTSNNFEDLFFSLINAIHIKKIPAEHILLNSKTTSKFVVEVVNSEKSDWVDPVHEAELIKAGHVGKCAHWGAGMLLTKPNIVDADPIPEEDVYALASPPYIGGAPVRVELFAEPLNQVGKDGKFTKGLYFYKLMSMVVINPNSIVRGKLDDYKLCA